MNVPLIIGIILGIIALIFIIKILKGAIKTAATIIIVALVLIFASLSFSVSKDLDTINVQSNTFMIKENNQTAAVVKNFQQINESDITQGERILTIDASQFSKDRPYAEQLQEKLATNPKEYIIANAKSEPNTPAFKYPLISKIVLSIKK